MLQLLQKLVSHLITTKKKVERYCTEIEKRGYNIDHEQDPTKYECQITKVTKNIQNN